MNFISSLSSQFDFESALTEMVRLVVNPSEVYRLTQLRYRLRKHWYRSSPAFIILQIYFFIVACLPWTITFNVSGWMFLRATLGSIFIEFLLIGALLSSVFWFIVNHLFIENPSLSTISSNPFRASDPNSDYLSDRSTVATKVEWRYSFDIHSNSFFPFFLLMYVVQFFLLPIVMIENFIGTIVGNTLFISALASYLYITCTGYSILPFVNTQKIQQIFYYGSSILLFSYIVLTLFGQNLALSILKGVYD